MITCTSLMSGTALSLMWYRHHNPHPHSTMVAKTTMKRLRIEALMTRSSIAASAPRCRSGGGTCLRLQRHRIQRLVQVGFRIDQKLRRSHHLLAFAKAREHRVMATGFAADEDFARLEMAL